MPLKRAPGVHRVDQGMVFVMRDTQTGNAVPCKISSAALARLTGRDGLVWLEAAFNEHRDAIETIASRLYDAGEAAPFLLAADV